MNADANEKSPKNSDVEAPFRLLTKKENFICEQQKLNNGKYQIFQCIFSHELITIYLMESICKTLHILWKYLKLNLFPKKK